MGGADLSPDGGKVCLARYILEVSGKRRPRVAFVPTAAGEDASRVLAFYQTYSRLTPALSDLSFFRRTPADLREFVLTNDVIIVGCGNTKSMLAVWREYAFDKILLEAWQQGIVLSGSSAGSICWFQEGLTDSIAEGLTSLTCLGFLPGSNCPHYDTEKERRPTYQRLIRDGAIADGYAADEDVGLHFINCDLYQAVSANPKNMAYRVERAARSVREDIVPTRRLQAPRKGSLPQRRKH